MISKLWARTLGEKSSRSYTSSISFQYCSIATRTNCARARTRAGGETARILSIAYSLPKFDESF